MQYGLSGAPLPPNLLYAPQIQAACTARQFSPFVAYSIAMRETIRGQIDGQWPDAATVVASDNGTGLFQITQESWWPAPMAADWAACNHDDPQQNCNFALKWLLLPAESYWATQIGLTGDPLIKCVADEFNRGRTAVINARALGNADLPTAGGNYGTDVVDNYHRLVNGQAPV